jgi:hypothetical protein
MCGSEYDEWERQTCINIDARAGVQQESIVDQSGKDLTDINTSGISAAFPGSGIPSEWGSSDNVLNVCYNVSNFI